MSRICLIVCVCAVVVNAQLALSASRISVSSTHSERSLTVRGGAASCAYDYPGGLCYSDTPVELCKNLVCTLTLSPGPYPSSAPLRTWDCTSNGKIRTRSFWWNCTLTSDPQWFAFTSTTCGTSVPGTCFDIQSCTAECKEILGIFYCIRRYPIPNLPISSGFFDETLGDTVPCSIQQTASMLRSRSSIAVTLPSFRMVK